MNASDRKAYTIQGVDSMSDDIASPLHLAPVEGKATRVNFDGGRLSSDGGLVLLGDPDEQLGLTRDLAAVLRDRRDPRRIDFTLHDLLKQRVLQIAAGYEDANDANTLRHDPIFTVLLGRLPESGPPLAGCLSFGTTPQTLASISHCALPDYQALPPEISCNRWPAVGISENFDR